MVHVYIQCEACARELDLFFFDDENICAFCSDKPRVFKSKSCFFDRICELGGRIIGRYINANIGVQCKCSKGHDCNPLPSNVYRGQGICKKCTSKKYADKKSSISKKKFHDKIKELGGIVLGKYTGSNKPVKCKCSRGHDCNPRPGHIQQGRGMCLVCSGHDPDTAKQNFYDNIKKFGGEVLGEYVRSSDPIKCRCSEGHNCNPIPNCIQQGQGMCKICAGHDSDTAKKNFYSAIEEFGGEVLGEYVRSNDSIKCRCFRGHICNPTPGSIQQGNGMCLVCSGHDSDTAKQNFYDKINEFGGTVLRGIY